MAREGDEFHILWPQNRFHSQNFARLFLMENPQEPRYIFIKSHGNLIDCQIYVLVRR